jgi:hypothetical protein
MVRIVPFSLFNWNVLDGQSSLLKGIALEDRNDWGIVKKGPPSLQIGSMLIEINGVSVAAKSYSVAFPPPYIPRDSYSGTHLFSRVSE